MLNKLLQREGCSFPTSNQLEFIVKIRNVLLHTAVASAIIAMSGGAIAGTLSGSTTFAAELFGAGSSTLALQPTALTYTYSTPGGIVINPGGTLNMYFRVGNGATFNGAPIGGNFTGTVITALSLTVGVPTTSTDGTTIVVPLTNNNIGNVTIGVGATLIYTPAIGALLNGTSNGTIAASASASVAPASVNAPTLPSDVEPVISLNYTTTAEAVVTLVVPSSSFPSSGGAAETARIDLTVPGAPGSRFTNAAPYPNANANSTTLINLGAVRFTETLGTQQTAVAGADYTIAGRATGGTALSGTVTGNFKTGSTAALTSDAACLVPIANGSAGTLNVGLTTFTFAGGTTPTSGANNYVCMTVPATNATIPVTEPTASFTYAKAAATDLADTAAGTLYSLQQNGATAELRNYIPAAVTGYINVARVINTGSISAQVSVALIDEASGVVGTAVPVGGVLPAGAAMRLTQTQIEAAVGTLSASVRPRLRFTAPTNGLEVQSFANTPNGAYSNISGKE